MNVTFRPSKGAGDAAGLARVHQERLVEDGVVVGLGFEANPSVEHLATELTTSDPEDWAVVEVDREVVGYGHTLYDWAEHDGRRCYLHLGWVMPVWRGRGIGRELLKRLEERCRLKAAADGLVGRADFGANASSGEASATRLLLRCGYSVVYTAIAMELSEKEPVRETDLPVGYELRAVLAEHHRAIWQMVGDAYFEPTESGHGSEIADEDRYIQYFRGDPSLWLVAWRGSRVAGAVLCRTTDGAASIYEVSVGHFHRRRGLAKALLTRALRKLLSQSPESVRIVTKKEFVTQAWRLYESVGFRTIKEFPRWRKPLG